MPSKEIKPQLAKQSKSGVFYHHQPARATVHWSGFIFHVLLGQALGQLSCSVCRVSVLRAFYIAFLFGAPEPVLVAKCSEPRLDSSTAILDSPRQSSTDPRQLDSLDSSCQAVKLTASRQLLDSFSTALDSSTATKGSGAVKAVKLSTRQLDSSTARQLDS